MLNWLIEASTTIYLLLGTVAVILAALWWRTRRRNYLIAIGVVALLAGLVWLTDFLVVTDRERIQNNLQAMAEGVQARNVDAVFQHISDQFTSPGGSSKSQYREVARGALNRGQVTDIIIWDVAFEEGASPESGTMPVIFMVKVRGNVGRLEDAFYRCRATFVLEDGDWRLRTFRLFDPVTNQEITGIP